MLTTSLHTRGANRSPVTGSQHFPTPQSGFSLMEMLVAVMIVGLLAAFAIPAYNDYIDSSEEAALTAEMATIEVFQEDFRLRTGGYAVNLANLAAITPVIDWDPRSDNTYVLANTATTTYRLTGTTPAGVVVCMDFPAKTRC